MIGFKFPTLVGGPNDGLSVPDWAWAPDFGTTLRAVTPPDTLMGLEPSSPYLHDWRTDTYHRASIRYPGSPWVVLYWHIADSTFDPAVLVWERLIDMTGLPMVP